MKEYYKSMFWFIIALILLVVPGILLFAQLVSGYYFLGVTYSIIMAGLEIPGFCIMSRVAFKGYPWQIKKQMLKK